jgi:UDP-N-acetylmuramoyl-tripeptide--D-alanyl-D-alanine ligase
MLELGDSAVDEHAALGARVAELGIDRLVAVGEHAATMVGGATWGGLDPNSTVILDSKSTAAEHVVPYLRPGDVVLVKASRGLALDTVAEEIWTAAPSTLPPAAGTSPEPTEPADSEDPA